MVGVSLLGVGQRAPRQRRPAYYAMFALTELVAIVVAVMFFLDSAGLLGNGSWVGSSGTAKLSASVPYHAPVDGDLRQPGHAEVDRRAGLPR